VPPLFGRTSLAPLAGVAPDRTACSLFDLAPPVVAIGEVRAADNLCIGDLRALHGIELHVSIELHKDELYSSKQQGDIAPKAHVASVCFECFSCFRGMLQEFRMDVAKVN
jgi:hypothetical protein